MVVTHFMLFLLLTCCIGLGHGLLESKSPAFTSTPKHQLMISHIAIYPNTKECQRRERLWRTQHLQPAVYHNCIAYLKRDCMDNDTDANTNKDEQRWQPLSLKEKVATPILLILAIYLLLLLPSGLAIGYSTGSACYCGARIMGSLPYEYFAFFAVGTLYRAFRYGKYASSVELSVKNKNNPNQNGAGTTNIEFIAFILSIMISHWLAAYQYALLVVQQQQQLFAVQSSIGIIMRVVAILLMQSSAMHLGKNYDRVVEPDVLIVSGPYKLIRNPIYTSYLLLFFGTLLSLNSFTGMILLMTASFPFYNARIKSEEQVLLEAFGNEYANYQEQVPWKLVPFVI